MAPVTRLTRTPRETQSPEEAHEHAGGKLLHRDMNRRRPTKANRRHTAASRNWFHMGGGQVGASPHSVSRRGEEQAPGGDGRDTQAVCPHVVDRAPHCIGNRGALRWHMRRTALAHAAHCVGTCGALRWHMRRTAFERVQIKEAGYSPSRGNSSLPLVVTRLIIPWGKMSFGDLCSVQGNAHYLVILGHGNLVLTQQPTQSQEKFLVCLNLGSLLQILRIHGSILAQGRPDSPCQSSNFLFHLDSSNWFSNKRISYQAQI